MPTPKKLNIYLISGLVFLTGLIVGIIISTHKTPPVIQSTTQSNAPEIKTTAEKLETTKKTEHGKREITVAIALSGCVITEQNGSRMKWREKCNYCGHLGSGGGECEIPDTHVSYTSRGDDKCARCKRISPIRFRSILQTY